MVSHFGLSVVSNKIHSWDFFKQTFYYYKFFLKVINYTSPFQYQLDEALQRYNTDEYQGYNHRCGDIGK